MPGSEIRISRPTARSQPATGHYMGVGYMGNELRLLGLGSRSIAQRCGQALRS